MRKLLIVLLILFTNCSNFIISEEQKNWCFGELNQFNDSLISWIGVGGQYYDTPSDKPTEFTKSFLSRQNSAIQLFNNKYDNAEYIETYASDLYEEAVGYDVMEGYTLPYFFNKALMAAILEENTDALRFCEIFYEVSN